MTWFDNPDRYFPDTTEPSMSVAKGTKRPITVARELVQFARPILDDDGNAIAWILTRRERAALLEILDEGTDASRTRPDSRRKKKSKAVGKRPTQSAIRNR